MIGIPDVMVLTAIVLHPQVHCQSKDDQTKHKVLKLPRDSKRTEQENLTNDPASQDETGSHRDQHGEFAMQEYRCSGY